MNHEPWFDLVLAVLATWRLSHLLALEDGPGNTIVNLRQWLGDGFFGQLMDCFFCTSLWIAGPLTYPLKSTWSEWPLLWLAVSGAACLLQRLSDRSVAQPILSDEASGKESIV